jgi:hypothetical protein
MKWLRALIARPADALDCDAIGALAVLSHQSSHDRDHSTGHVHTKEPKGDGV